MSDIVLGSTLHVCMLVTNDMFSDPRVSRHAVTLARQGFKVSIICPLSDRTRRAEVRDGYEILRVRSEFFGYWEKLAKRRKGLSAPSLSPKGALGTTRERLRLKRMLISHVKRTLLQLALLRTARKTRAHVYCANDLDTLLITTLAAGLDRPVVYDSHELWPDMLIGVPPFYKRMLMSFERLLIGRADSVMTVNSLIANVLTSRYSLKKPVNVIHNFPNREPTGPKRAMTSGDKIALYQGGYLPERGLENLVIAAQYLTPDVRLVLRGFGDIEERLRMLAVGHANVCFEEPAALEQLVDLAGYADVGIVSYLPTNLCNYLASPNKLFEYINAGLPIVTSDLPFLRKIVIGNNIGILFDPKDPKSIAAAINQATRPGNLEKFRRNVAAVAPQFTWRVEAPKLLQVYKSCVKRRTPTYF